MLDVIKSSSYLVIQKILQRSLGLISTVILARLLTPEDFGVVAVAMLTLWFVESIADAGTESYILQQKNVSDTDLNSAWTLNFLLKSASFFLLLILAPIVAWEQGNENLLSIIAASGSIIMITAFQNPGLMLLKRRQNYSGIVKIILTAKAVSLFISIPVAFYYRSYWALIMGQIAMAAVATLLSYRISSYRPHFSIKNIPNQWSFSKWLIPRAIIGYFRNHLDTIMVGSFFRASDLGAYNNLKYFSSIPMLQFLSPLVEPLHVEMGKVGEDIKEMEYQANLTMKILTLFAAPIIGFLFVGSTELVALILGSQWISYSYIFSYLALLTFPFVILTQSFRILMVTKNTKLIFLYEALSIIGIGSCLFIMKNSILHDFIVVKVLVETMFASILYFYTYNVALKGNATKNYISFLIFSVLSVILLYAAKAIVAPSLSGLVLIAFLAIMAALNFLLLCGLAWWLMAEKREKRLILQIFSQFRLKYKR